MSRIVFLPSEAEPQGASAKVNHSEACITARLAADIYRQYAGTFESTRTLGIITPYRSQIALIKRNCHVGNPGTELNSGRYRRTFSGKRTRCHHLFILCKLPYQLRFLSNLTEENGVLIDRKLNVALTRARKQMFITGVPRLLEQNPIYDSLIKLIKQREALS